MSRIYDCPPSMDEFGVIDFCKNGFLLFPGVVPEEINERTIEFIETNPGPVDYEPSHILDEDWFVENVICQPAAAGAVRCLLGRDFGLPILMSSHKVECPQPAQEWHRDGGSRWGPQVNYLQVFYYPQETPAEMGPTELLPGSHHLFSLSTHMGHYGSIDGARYAECPAGSIVITAYNIWHRRGKSTGSGVRHNLKYNYWRTTPPGPTWKGWPTTPTSTLRTSTGGLRRPHRSASSSATPSTRPRCSSGSAAATTSSRSSAARAGPCPATALSVSTASPRGSSRGGALRIRNHTVIPAKAVRNPENPVSQHTAASRKLVIRRAYEYLEERRVFYAIRLPSNKVLQYEIAPLLIRPVGRPPKRPVILYDDFWYRAESWDHARRVVAKVEWHRESCSLGWASSSRT